MVVVADQLRRELLLWGEWGFGGVLAGETVCRRKEGIESDTFVSITEHYGYINCATWRNGKMAMVLNNILSQLVLNFVVIMRLQLNLDSHLPPVELHLGRLLFVRNIDVLRASVISVTGHCSSRIGKILSASG